MAESVAASVESLRSDIGDYKDTNAGSAGRIQETLDSIGGAVGTVAATLDVIRDRERAAPAESAPGDVRTVELLEAQARALRETQSAVGQLTRAVEASRTETAGLRDALGQTCGAGSDLRALDAWRDDFTRHVNALLARARDASKDIGLETPPAPVEGITERLSLLEDDVGKATEKMEKAIGTFTTFLTRHDQTLRHAECSSLLTRKQVEFLRLAFDAKEKEYRRLRYLWVSLPVILIAGLAGMALESRMHWFYWLFR